MRTNIPQRKASFVVEAGCLVRIVTGGDGRTYTHRCAKRTFEAIAEALSWMPRDGAGISLIAIARQENVPSTQANVAIEFLKDRGIVEDRTRRSYPAVEDVYLDAMVEYHALTYTSSLATRV